MQGGGGIYVNPRWLHDDEDGDDCHVNAEDSDDCHDDDEDDEEDDDDDNNQRREDGEGTQIERVGPSTFTSRCKKNTTLEEHPTDRYTPVLSFNL